MKTKCNRKIIKRRHRQRIRRLQFTHELTQNMGSLFKSGDFSDITLRCGSHRYRAHKNILSCRSPVFKAMFINPMKESKQDYVDISGIEPDILLHMLSYIYCSQIRVKEESFTCTLACKLLHAGDMYQLPGLKKLCVDFLVSKMCRENVFTILRIADLYDNTLLSEALKYISNRFDEFEVKPEWSSLQKEKPHLAVSIMQSKINFLRNHKTKG